MENHRDTGLSRELQHTQALEEFEPAAEAEKVPLQSRTLLSWPLTEAETTWLSPLTESTESCPAAEDALLSSRRATMQRRPPQHFTDFVM